jgi:hypothetical protein
MGLSLWCEDETGPFQTIPYPGQSWAKQARRQPHEYVRNGTAKQLTLFHPATGRLRIEGVRSANNQTLHSFLKRELTAVLNELPEPEALPPEQARQEWLRWQEGLTRRITLAEALPRLRVLLILDNLTGHYTPSLVLWFFGHGIMPLYTPLGGSWLNMAESIQRVIKRRALAGQHPRTPQAIIENLEGAARAWNRHPTPFTWGGKRQARRRRQRARKEHALGGSCAVAKQSLRRSRTVLAQWQDALQLTH